MKLLLVISYALMQFITSPLDKKDHYKTNKRHKTAKVLVKDSVFLRPQSYKANHTLVKAGAEVITAEAPKRTQNYKMPYNR